MSRGSLAAQVLKGNKRAAAELISLLERRQPAAAVEMKKLARHAGKAHLVGVTGAQGVGKSSLIDQLIEIALRRKKKVGVIAIDPTSPLSGGAFLGDRIRMQRHAAQSGVFIRSMAARGTRGGLSPALRDAIRVIDALGSDLIFVETVGVGQDEVEISTTTDTTLLVLTPQSGDKIQALKAGLLETCDILVINKSDLPGAQNLEATLQSLVPTPLFRVSSVKGTGIGTLYEQIEQHRRETSHNGTAQLRRQQNFRAEVRQKAEESLVQNLDTVWKSKAVQTLLQKAAKKNAIPDNAAREILKKIKLKR